MYSLHVGNKHSESISNDRWEREGARHEWIMPPETERDINIANFGYWV